MHAGIQDLIHVTFNEFYFGTQQITVNVMYVLFYALEVLQLHTSILFIYTYVHVLWYVTEHVINSK